MKKWFFYLMSFIFILLSSTLAAAKDVDLILPSEITFFSGESKDIDALIINNQNVADNFAIYIFPSIWNKISAAPEKMHITIGANCNATVKLFFSAPIEAEELISLFTVTIFSESNKEVFISKTIQVNLKRKSPLSISSFNISEKTINPGEMITITVNISNAANIDSDEHTLIINIENKSIENRIVVGARSFKILSFNYTFDKYAPPGTYSVSASLKDNYNKEVDRRQDSVKVRAIYVIPEKYTEKTKSLGFLYSTITIKIKNEGNIESPAFFVTEVIPLYASSLFEPIDKPAIESRSNNKILYSWLVPPLGPGEEITIKYRVVVWKPVLAIVIIILLIYFFLRITLAPSISKRSKHIPGKEILVSLEIKNRGFSEIKNVVITDFVPPMMQVLEKFETVKPKIRKSRKGCELVWTFDVLKPGEDRILIYRIKPILEIKGMLKLPSATMEYVVKTEKKIISSKAITLA